MNLDQGYKELVMDRITSYNVCYTKLLRSYVVRCALQLAPLVFVRPGELRKAEWQEINFETAEWRIPAEKMKTKVPMITTNNQMGRVG